MSLQSWVPWVLVWHAGLRSSMWTCQTWLALWWIHMNKPHSVFPSMKNFSKIAMKILLTCRCWVQLSRGIPAHAPFVKWMEKLLGFSKLIHLLGEPLDKWQQLQLCTACSQKYSGTPCSFSLGWTLSQGHWRFRSLLPYHWGSDSAFQGHH